MSATLIATSATVVVLGGLALLFLLHFERFVGLRYLIRSRASGTAARALIVSLLVTAIGFAVFAAAHGQHRGVETAGLLTGLLGTLAVLTCVLLRAFSVFTTVSTMGVVLGVASLVVVMQVTSGFEKEFQDKVLGLNAHLIVIPYGQVDIDAPEVETIRRRLDGLPGVRHVAQFVFSAGEVMVGSVGANLKGIDLGAGADDLRTAMVDGNLDALGKPARCPLPETAKAFGMAGDSAAGRIVLGAELARKLRVGVGDCLPLMVPFPADVKEPPTFVFKVVGIFRMGFHEYDTRLAYVGLEDARRIGDVRAQVVGVELRFDDPMVALSDDTKTEVRRRLGRPHRIIDWADLNHNLFTALRVQKSVISLLLVLIIVVAAFNIIASLTMIVLSKVREIAILKAMGTRSAGVARIFLVSGMAVGSAGTGLGLGYGLLVCALARVYGYPLDPRVYLIGQLPVRFDALETALVAAVTLAICFIATLYPALRAARMKPVDGLRYD